MGASAQRERWGFEVSCDVKAGAGRQARSNVEAEKGRRGRKAGEKLGKDPKPSWPQLFQSAPTWGLGAGLPLCLEI